MELSDSTIVRCRLDNGEWLLCEKKEELDVNVARGEKLESAKNISNSFQS